jgi:Fur family transcriptional regulator, peroxide stress response regulator
VPEISRSTVYYTLNLLKDAGLIKELEFYEQESRYESNMNDHVDLICVERGKIENFNGDINLSPVLVEASKGFKAQKMRFEYYGLCRECRGKKT